MTTYELQLRKNGVLFSKDWSVVDRDYIEEEVEDFDLIFNLDGTVCLESGVTLKDIFMFISQNIEIWSVVTSCPFLEEMVSEVMRPFSHDKDLDDISFLELGWTALISANAEEEGEFLNEDSYFHGVSFLDVHDVGFIPLNKISQIPIIINERYTILNSEKEKLLETKKKFTLSELIDGIILELALNGPPDMRDEILGDDEDTCEYYNDTLSSEPFEFGYKVFNDLEIDKKINGSKYEKPCKNCGKDSRSSMFGKPNDICVACFKKIKEN